MGERGSASRLRHEIDGGRMRDKVAYPDPAAAPLGTDDEAAGTSDPLEGAEQAEAGDQGAGPIDPPAGRADPVAVFISISLAVAFATLAGIVVMD